MKHFLLLGLFFSMVAMADTPAPGTVKAKMYSGDGLNPVSVTSDGSINVNLGGASGFTVNQGDAGVQSWLATITSSALPTNACQEDGGHLASIDSKLSTPMPVTGTFFQTTQPVSAASLPLPSGASTAAKQPALGTAGTPSSDVITVQGATSMTALKVDGSSFTQPVSGTFFQATQPVSLLSLPSLAAGSNLIGNVGVTGSVSVTGTFWQATQPVSIASVPLPSGAATEATLSSIDGKTPALGQALAAGSVPVVLTAAQVSTLTPPTTITANAGTGTFTVDGSGHTQPVSGTVTANAGSGTFAVSAASLPLPSGAATAVKQPALGTAGTPSADVITVQGATSMTALKTDGSATTQPVSGTVTANIGTSGSLALNSTVAGLQVAQGSTTSGQSGSLALGAVSTAAPSYTTAQSSPFSLTTAGALRIDGSGSTQPVSGTFWQATQPVSGTFWQATQPVSLATLPALTASSAVIGHVIVDTAPTTAVTGTFWQATQPVSIATAPALVASSAIIGKVGIDQTTPGTTNGVQVNAALPAGTNVIGHVIVDTAPSTAVTNAGTFAVQSTPVVPAAVTVKQAAITIGTSAVRLTTDGLAPSSTRVLLVAQLLSSSTANCFFGSSGVTSSSTTRGVQMFAGQSFSFTKDAGDYYAICDAASQTFLITEQE